MAYRTQLSVCTHLSRLFALTSCSCLFASHGAAQVLEEIIVTAQKRAENIQDVPIAISALDSRVLERSNIERIDDLTFYVPNLQFGNFSTTATVALRGIGSTNTTAGGDPGVALHLDGVYLARPMATVFSAYDLERMEVLRGPQGTLYGRNTTGGSINYITKEPTDEFEGEVDVSYGEFDHAMARGILNIPITDRISSRFNVVWSDSDGYQENLVPGGSESGDNDFINFRGAIRAALTDSMDLLVSVNHSDVSGVGSSSQTRLPHPTDTTVDWGPPIPGFRNFVGNPDQYLQTILSDEFFNRPDINARLAANGINSVADIESFLAARGQIQPGPGGIGLFVPTPGGSVIPAPWLVDDGDFSQTEPNDIGANKVRKNTSEENEQEFTSISATFTWDLDWAEFKSITAYAEVSADTISDTDATESSLLDLRLVEDQDQFSQEIQLASTGTGPLTWIVGAYYFEEEGERLSLVANPDFDAFAALLALPEGFNVGGTVDAESYALFAQASYELNETLRLTAGYRYSWDEKEAVINLVSPFPSYELATLVFDDRADESWSEPTYKIVADWRATDDIMLYASFSQGYKSGGINTNVPAEDAVYDPEFVDVWEVGAKMTFANRFQLNVAAFTNDYTDIQVQSFGPTGALIVNAAAATINGAEVEGVFAVSENTEFNFSISWLDTEFDEFLFDAPALPAFPFLASPGDIRAPSDPTNPLGGGTLDYSGNELARAPEYTFNAGAQHVLQLGKGMGSITFRADYYWQDEQWFDFDNGIGTDGVDALGDSFHNLDLRARWESENQTYFVEVFGQNVTDEDQIQNIFIGTAFHALGVDLTTYNAPSRWSVRAGYRF